MKKFFNSEDLENYRKEVREKASRFSTLITVCQGGCKAFGSEEILERLSSEVRERRLNKKVLVKMAGCHGFCERGPLVLIFPKGIFYGRVTVKDVPEIVEETIVKNRLVDRLLVHSPKDKEKIPLIDQIPFYKRQMRLVLKHNGRINPESLDDYLEVGGYSALAKALNRKPGDIINEVKISGLRGRGGAGFPTGLKWELTARAIGDTKYIICNADEGDPGAFMDRSVLEGNPHSVLEGMIIGGYAIGANEGYIYVRAEYPLAIERLRIAVEKCEATGILGENILGSGFSFSVKIKEGAGAFVCGEETALIASIEGKRGMPRPRPPFPAQSGLWGKPTCINNVETFANIPLIILDGGGEYSKVGAEKSKGTKIFSLTGKVNNTGLVEVPIGTKLRDVIFEIGGGVDKGRTFKAVQTGGPSGGCIPGEYLDLPIDYETLAEVGSIMGSGGMIVLDDKTCMVELTHYFLSFTQNESCGKCTPCRIGTKRCLEILEKITRGEGEEKDLDDLLELAKIIKDTSLCGLGQTAPNPILSTIRYFKDEYETHIKDKKCPAGVCKALIKYYIDEAKCKGCTLCAKNCPVGAIAGEVKKKHMISLDKCIKCGVCLETCKFNAVVVE